MADAAHHTPASRFCHLCGHRLRERYYRYESALVVCHTCYTRRPRCARCDVPLADVAASLAPGEAAGSPLLCATCRRSTPRCAACDLPIIGAWYTFEELLPVAQPRHFCLRCVESHPRCDLCRAPLPALMAPLDDGQYRCVLCATQMVLDAREVQAVYTEALAGFRTALGESLRETPRLEVVGRRRMGELHRQYEGREPVTAGRTPQRQRHTTPPTTLESEAASGHHILGYYVYTHGSSSIYVERGLPRALLLGTLAHELGHAWQTEHAPQLRDLLLREGFAEWAAHRVLVARGQTALAARATHREDIYGRGLRHFLAIEQASGRRGVLTAARGDAE